MNTAVMTAGQAQATSKPATSGNETQSPSQDGRYQAVFWRSPFAVTAAVLVSTQLSLLALGVADGPAFPYEAAFCMTGLAGMMLAAGVFPAWNYLAVTEDHLDQQAGLRSLKVAWADVQHVRVFDGWCELRVVTGAEAGRRKVVTKRVFNRYELSPEAFGTLIEDAWLGARR